MQIHLVGGAVRDELLGLPVGERDWVVTGASPEDMLAAGYKPVGNDFPVFLHPQSHEEYALARTERKHGHGYHGFTFYTGTDVSLEADLIRRDLTVNAMARGAEGELIDPYGGQRDLAAKVLRHVSPAFAEDPLRILRVARFHTRFAPLGFTVADETLALMRAMVDNGEVDHLVPERVWKELARALMHAQPSTFMTTLREVGALKRLLPEVDALFGVPQTAKYHPEIDTGIHVMMALDMTARLHAPLEVRVATLVHDLGKALTPARVLPGHRGHEATGVPLVRALCQRLRIPNACRDLAVLVTREHLNVHRAMELRPPTILKLLERMDALRQPQRFQLALLACECDSRGRKGLQEAAYPQARFLLDALQVANSVQAQAVVADGFSGPDIGRELAKRRAQALSRWRSGQGAGGNAGGAQP